MSIRVTCAQCGAKLKVKDEFGGRMGRCPSCKAEMRIPAATPKPQPAAAEPSPADTAAPPLENGAELADDLLGDLAAAAGQDSGDAPETSIESALPLADELFDEDFANAPTLEEKAAEQSAQGGGDDPIPFDSLLDDDEPPPQIILAGGEKPGESSLGSGIDAAAPSSTPKPSQHGERIFDPGELPKALGKKNHYLVCDHKDVVARWEYDGKGWMIHLKDGFTRAATVENQIPQFGNFILVEVAVEQRDDGLHLESITPYQLRRQYSLTKIAKGDDAILETIVDYAELNDRQRTHVKNLVKQKFLPHLWGEMEVMLGFKEA